ncbi:acyl-CoA dehydrogenase C-terminal domain-containing protein, partial [Stenotrophomonas sp. BIIR7]|uniref:acyl-CoA dehydrogenase C-terminal domain-containing protein n=3 Tax=Stenotrophomonas TaxID=40323 RepID=UPI000AE3FD3C
DASAQSDAFKQAKRETARFYFARMLPRTLSHAAAIQAGADSLMAMEDARFGE